MTKKNTILNDSDKLLEENASDLSPATDDKKEEIKDALDAPNVVDTMQFYVTNEYWENDLKNALKIINPLSLKDARLICFEYKDASWKIDSQWWGIDFAWSKFLQNPDAPIILTSIFTPDSKEIQGKKDKLDILLSKPNVKFIRLPFAPSDLLKLFEEPDYLSTITFKMWEKPEEMVDSMKESLRKINLKNLNNSIFIDVCAIYKEWQWLQNMEGLSLAMEELQKNPDKKIILTVPLADSVSLQALATKAFKKDKLNFLLWRKNVAFFAYGDDIKKLETIFDESEHLWDKEVSDTEVAFQKIMESEISHFLHDAKYWIDRDKQQNMIYEEQLEYFFFHYQGEKTDKRLAFEERLISVLQMQHPSFKLLPRENNLQWIVDMYKYSRMQTLPEWTRFEGVFVDWDGTLYDNKNLQFNQYVIDMIKEYEWQWKKIVIWTGWNLAMKQKLLDEAWLHYTIQNKSDYKWWTVEMTIDNDSEEFLLANAKIKTENHIKV